MDINFTQAEPIFEYDPNKNASNLAKHGIDFEQAKLLWDDEKQVIAQSWNEPEIRYMLIAKLADKHWSAFFTMRNNVIRLISVRRSRRKEIICYEQYH